MKPEELTAFEVGDAVARIGTDIVKIKTKEPLPVPAVNYQEKIIAESHKKFYKPVSEIKAELANRGVYRKELSGAYESTLSQQDLKTEKEEFKYEEFD